MGSRNSIATRTYAYMHVNPNSPPQAARAALALRAGRSKTLGLRGGGGGGSLARSEGLPTLSPGSGPILFFHFTHRAQNARNFVFEPKAKRIYNKLVVSNN